MNYVKFLIISLLFLPLSIPLQADEIYLNNGDRISGTLSNLSPTLCTFTTPYQAILHIPRQDLSRLWITHPVTVELQSGEKIMGIFTTNESGNVVLHSPRFGNVTLQLDEIVNVSGVAVSSDRPLTKTAGEKEKETEKEETLAQIQGRGTAETSDTIGKKPEEDTDQRKFFVRDAIVLLQPGDKELELSFNYARDATTTVRNREFTLPLNLHLGLTNRFEASLYIPLVWAENEWLSTDSAKTYQATGLGDIRADFSYLLLPEQEQWPDFVGVFSINSPTGQKPNFTDRTVVPLGGGFWRLLVGVNLMKTYDPAVLYGALHTFTAFLKTTREYESPLEIALSIALAWALRSIQNWLGVVNLLACIKSKPNLMTKNCQVPPMNPCCWKRDFPYA